jgi:hypothetical protein
MTYEFPTEGYWTYDGYWAAVLGASRTAGEVVREFDLVGGDDGERGLDEWLGHSEAEAWSQGAEGGDLPEEWVGYHARALRELGDAVAEAQIGAQK